jgi:hypothetical protein
MNLTIYTYGHIDAMFYVLNGIAMILSSPFADMMIMTISIVATAFYGFKAAYSAAAGGAKQQLVKIFGIILVVNALLVPKTSMMIEDKILKQKEKVDNIPYGFAIPVGYLEEFGSIVTQAFEQAFTPTGSSNYTEYGMVFGARLLQDARNWRIKTPEFSRDMDSFIRRCVIIQASIGTKYTINDLFETDNIWRLVKTKASPLTRVDMFNEGLVTCKEAAVILNNSFTDEITKFLDKYSTSDFANAGNDTFISRGAAMLRPNLKRNVDLVINSYLRDGTLSYPTAAESTFRQYMMINALNNFKSNDGYSRASSMQESNWQIAGDLASIYLPILLSVMKGLVYASFIYMVPLMLLSGGVGKYLTFLTVVGSLQLWPSLNAVLNMFIDLYSSSILQGISGGIISFTTYSKVGDYSDKIVAVASGLQMVVPFLAFAIVQGGVGGFIHLASSITGASSSAAASASQEIVSGNRSFDNYSSGNMQIAMQQGFKTDWNTSYRAGSSEEQLQDGSIQRTFADGNSMIQSGAGLNVSSGTRRFSIDESRVEQINNAYNKANSLVNSDTAEYSNVRSSILNEEANLIATIAKNEKEGKTFNYDKMGEAGKSLQSAVNAAKSYEMENRNAWNQAGRFAVNAQISGETPSVLGVKASITSQGTVEVGNTSDQSLNDKDSVTKSQDVNENFNNLIKASTNQSWMEDHGIDTSHSKNIQGSYSKMNSISESMAMHKEEARSYSEAKSKLESYSGMSSSEMYHVVEDRLMHDYGVSRSKAHSMIENNDLKADFAWDRVQQDVLPNLDSYRKTMKDSVSGQQADTSLELFKYEHQNKVSKDNIEYVNTRAQEKGLNQDEIRERINKSHSELSSKNQNMMNENEANIAIQKADNDNTHKNLEEKADKYEKDRIGQGKAAEFTRWSTGIDIGGPNKELREATKNKNNKDS